MNAKQEAIKYLKKNKCTPTDTEPVWYLPFIENAIDIAIKEVFDDIEKLKFQVMDGSLSGDLKYTHGYIELKKRHLPTFQKRKGT